MDFDIFIKSLIASMHSDAPVLNETGVAKKYIDVDFLSDKQSKESIINGMEKIGLKVELIQNRCGCWCCDDVS